jgi:transcriptional regulator GlxA family with amidase domain
MGHFSEAELLERGEADGRCALARSDDALPRRIVLVAFPQAQILDITGPMEILRGASVALQQFGGGLIGPAYQVELVAQRSGPLPTSCGLEILATGAFATCRGPIDTLMVAGGIVTEALQDRSLVPFLRDAASRARRVAAVCTGAFLLAEAGLLAGRRAVTHWRQCDRLARLYPDLTVEPDAIFVRDGSIYTSAGVTAAMELTLALVEEDLGRKVALEGAREKVMFMKRPGGQAQFSAPLVAQSAENPRFRVCSVGSASTSRAM